MHKKIILVTGHRRENFGQGFIDVCNALSEIAHNNKDVEIVYPVHLNPNVVVPVTKILKGISNIKLIKPLDYEPFIYLIEKSHFIITDSGGIQEEALTCGKHFLILRNSTERPEVIKSSFALLTGTDPERIIEGANFFLNSQSKFDHIDLERNPFGDGKVTQRIIKAIKEWDPPLN